jgi:guanylate kinase
MNKEKIIIITAPSGSGKTTLVRRLLADCPQLEFSISATTRKPRESETHGKDYYFYDQDNFKKLVTEHAFAEWEQVYPGKSYGTLKSELQRIWDCGKYPVLDIDVKGALSVQKAYPKTSLSIFIQAPSLQILKERLMKRGTETEHTLLERLSKADYELGFAQKFNTIIVNDNIDTAAVQLKQAVNEFMSE